MVCLWRSEDNLSQFSPPSMWSRRQLAPSTHLAPTMPLPHTMAAQSSPVQQPASIHDTSCNLGEEILLKGISFLPHP